MHSDDIQNSPNLTESFETVRFLIIQFINLPDTPSESK